MDLGLADCRLIRRSTSATSRALSGRPGARIRAERSAPRACSTCLRTASPTPGCCS